MTFRPLEIARLLAAPLAAFVLLGAGGEPNGAGDIPDTQAFVRYAAPAHYALLVPEGWSRTVRGASVRFSTHYDGLEVRVGPRADPAVAVRGIAPHMSAVRRSVVRLGGVPVSRLTFSSDSQPDPVTGKSVRLDDEAYLFTKGSRSAVLHLWAPHGADNADQWQKIAQSFRWS